MDPLGQLVGIGGTVIGTTADDRWTAASCRATAIITTTHTIRIIYKIRVIVIIVRIGGYGQWCYHGGGRTIVGRGRLELRRRGGDFQRRR